MMRDLWTSEWLIGGAGKWKAIYAWGRSSNIVLACRRVWFLLHGARTVNPGSPSLPVKETQFSNWCTQSSSPTRARTGIAHATTSIIMGGARGSAIPQLYTPTHFAVQSTALKIILPVAAWSEYACHAITNEGLVVRSRSCRPAKLLRGCARMRWNVLPSWPASRASHELGIECSSQHTLSAWMRWGGERVF